MATGETASSPVATVSAEGYAPDGASELCQACLDDVVLAPKARAIR